MTGQQDTTFLIVTGLSGSGKTMASKIFEDIGFFCVDNLPAPLLPRFAELVLQSEGSIQKVCLVIDLRSSQFGEGMEDALEALRLKGISYQILFMEASDETLVNRFKESRRHHPLSPGGTILDGIRKERERLQHVRGHADRVINTTRMSGKDLREEILNLWQTGENGMSVTVMSFGFKFGVPMDADIVMDVRFIENPFYVPELRELNGRDAPVRDYVLSRPEAQCFLKHFVAMLKDVLPCYIKEGKSHLSISLGCTGGQHRSIALANYVGTVLLEEGYKVIVTHRDH